MNAETQIRKLKSDLLALMDEKLAEIAAVANEAGVSVHFYDDGPIENLYLVNKQFLQDWHWEESDLEQRDISMGDWITSNQMDW